MLTDPLLPVVVLAVLGGWLARGMLLIVWPRLAPTPLWDWLEWHGTGLWRRLTCRHAGGRTGDGWCARCGVRFAPGAPAPPDPAPPPPDEGYTINGQAALIAYGPPQPPVLQYRPRRRRSA